MGTAALLAFLCFQMSGEKTGWKAILHVWEDIYALMSPGRFCAGEGQWWNFLVL